MVEPQSILIPTKQAVRNSHIVDNYGRQQLHTNITVEDFNVVDRCNVHRESQPPTDDKYVSKICLTV